MKVILVGYPGSQFLVPASKYLTTKYLPGFDIRYINHEGDVKDWSAFVADYMRTLDDYRIIFALDDYLIGNYINILVFVEALRVKPCVKLFHCTPEEHQSYPVTTQYTIWDRKELIELLEQTTTPWDFEMRGSQLFKGTSVVMPCLEYDTSSALSSRWSGVRLGGLKQEDIEVIQRL